MDLATRYIGASEPAAMHTWRETVWNHRSIDRLTSCDFTACFFRKRKVRPFQRLHESKSRTCCGTAISHQRTWTFLVLLLLSACCMANIIEARHKASSRPDWRRRLTVLRCHHVQKHFSITSEELARIWKRADETNPTGDASPTDYGWQLNQNCFAIEIRLVRRKFSSASIGVLYKLAYIICRGYILRWGGIKIRTRIRTGLEW